MKTKLLFAVLISCLATFNTPAQQCSANISYTQNPNSPDVTFTADSVIGIGTHTTYTWSFGDNTTGTGATATHTYTLGGFITTYNVCLTMVDSAASCFYNTCVPVTVPGPTGGNCTATAAYTHQDSLYTFVTTSTGNAPFTYSWSVNGISSGNTATINLVIDTLTNANYTQVCVAITDANGCTATDCSYVTNANTGNGCNTYVTYTNQDSLYTFFTSSIGGTPVAYQWVMNNSVVDTTGSFSVVIDSFPTTVCLTLVDANDSTCNNCLTIGSTPIGGNNPCQAYFVITADSANGLPGYYYGYNYSSGNFANDILWDFGDGSTSIDPYPTHTYATPGNYIVCLTVGVPGTSCYDTYCDSSFYAFKTEGGQMTHLTIASPTDIADLPKTAFHVYPNPVSNELTIESNVKIDLTRIFNLNGQKVFEAKGTTNKINLAKLPVGVYVLELNSGNKVSRTKLVKE